MFGLEMIYYQLILVGVLVVATLVGYKLINKVPPTLHTPLMSGMNALSGVTVLGALTATAAGYFGDSLAGKIVVSILGIFAIALAMVNVVGGFAVTDRMLGMIAKKKAKGQDAIYVAFITAAIGLIAVIGCFGIFDEKIVIAAKDGVAATTGAGIAYLVLSVVLSVGVLGGIAMMSKIPYSKIGNRVSGICMFVAIILTVLYSSGRVFKYDIVAAAWPIYIGLLLGSAVGIYLAKKVTMLQMPQMVALLNGLGGAASALVGAFSMFAVGIDTTNQTSWIFANVTSALALAVGMVTLLGSLVAAGKLHRILPQKPIVLKNNAKLHVFLQGLSACIMIASIIVFSATGHMGIGGAALNAVMFVVVLLSSSAFGLLFSLRVGGADMPITISLLNSFSGVAGAIAGLAIGDLLLVAIGGIVGASGLLLTQIMCKAMNRSLIAILTGNSGKSAPAPAAAPKAAPAPEKKVEEKKEEAKPEVIKEINYAASLKDAKEVIIVPGYGMAIAQAQHLVKKLADKLTDQGTKVKFAIHPVAGRMPGHMNVLLCEANVDYEDLYEMDAVNPEFKDADAAIVIGANDVTNPAASTAVGTPIYGMPVLNVNDCKNIFVFNYDLKPGYAGVENPIYSRKDGVHIYLGNAAETLSKFISDIDAPAETIIEAKAEVKKAAKKVEVNYAASLKGAKEVIIVPGYGMAIAQAQHLVKKLADKLTDQGTKVKFAIHPVAGRMPGHMNVLLCEANVDYEDLYEMDAVNPEFKDADAAIVIGANDVTNPAASTAVGTPIYGMPVLNVNDCKNIFVFNYDLKPGYAGVENPIYTREEGVHIYLGNAAETLTKFLSDIDAPAETVTEEEEVAEVAEKKDVNYAASLKGAKEVIIVPGYGMAIAQAQQLVKSLADKLTDAGTKVKYAIHPVAGRMPGHMNVLLCEANVDYEDLYEMDDVNPEFANADAAIVIGANDVTNPAASTAVGTPIYGMPVLKVNDCKNIFVFNYDLKPGYAGVENPIYTRTEGVHIYLGNAAETLTKFIADMDAPVEVEAPKAEAKAEAPKAEENAAKELVGAKEVIIVPGYGMAIAQAQHLVKGLADKLVGQGTKVKYAIHPVAGRMPGHMNVLLCEADVDYEDLYEMDDINPEFANADAAIVIGANDVTNPAASTAVGTPIYGMPVLKVNDCKNIFVFNYDLKPGYAGVENPIYSRTEGVHIYLGNAAETLQKFILDMDK